MSLILDALNRADQERSQDNSAPNLHSGHSSTTQPEQPIRRWLIEGAVILLAAAAVIVSLFFNNTVSTEHDGTATTLPPAPAPVTAPADTEPAVAPGPDAPTTATTAVITPATAKKPASAKTEQTGTAAAETSAARAAIDSLYQQQAEPSADNVQTPAIEQPIVAAPEPRPVDNSQAILQQIPLLAQMPTRFQNAIPSIDYSVHVYSDRENAGFVNLNGSIRKIGSKITPELIVIAILKDSVVLDYNGTQFRLLALNSWVNFN